MQNKLTKWFPCGLWLGYFLVNYIKMVSNLLLLKISPSRVFSSLLEKRLDLIMWLYLEWLEMSLCLSKQLKWIRQLNIKFLLICCLFGWFSGRTFWLSMEMFTEMWTDLHKRTIYFQEYDDTVNQNTRSLALRTSIYSQFTHMHFLSLHVFSHSICLLTSPSKWE